MKNCIFCGKELEENAKYCSGCGTRCPEDAALSVSPCKDPAQPEKGKPGVPNDNTSCRTGVADERGGSDAKLLLEEEMRIRKRINDERMRATQEAAREAARQSRNQTLFLVMTFLSVIAGWILLKSPLISYGDSSWGSASLFEILDALDEYKDHSGTAMLLLILAIAPFVLIFIGGLAKKEVLCSLSAGFGSCIDLFIVVGCLGEINEHADFLDLLNVFSDGLHFSYGFWVPLIALIACLVMSAKIEE